LDLRRSDRVFRSRRVNRYHEAEVIDTIFARNCDRTSSAADEQTSVMRNAK
jgi:hypothetical protein